MCVWGGGGGGGLRPKALFLYSLNWQLRRDMVFYFSFLLHGGRVCTPYTTDSGSATDIATSTGGVKW